MVQPKYKQFDGQKSLEGEQEDAGGDLLPIRNNNCEAQPRSWGQLFLVVSLTFLLWMIIFSFTGPTLRISVENCGQLGDSLEIPASAFRSNQSPEDAVEILEVGIVELSEAQDIDTTKTKGEIPSLASEGLAKTKKDFPSTPLLSKKEVGNSIHDEHISVPVKEPAAPAPAAAEIEKVPEEAILSIPVDWVEAELESKGLKGDPASDAVGDDDGDDEEPKELVAILSGSIFQKYYVSAPDEKLTWTDALETCLAYDMQLVAIESEAKNKDVMAALRWIMQLDDITIIADDIWTSGRRMNKSTLKGSGGFYWAVNGHSVNYTDWIQPRVVDPNHSCIAITQMDPALPEKFGWRDTDCGTSARFMCEILDGN